MYDMQNTTDLKIQQKNEILGNFITILVLFFLCWASLCLVLLHDSALLSIVHVHRVLHSGFLSVCGTCMQREAMHSRCRNYQFESLVSGSPPRFSCFVLIMNHFVWPGHRNRQVLRTKAITRLNVELTLTVWGMFYMLIEPRVCWWLIVLINLYSLPWSYHVLSLIKLITWYVGKLSLSRFGCKAVENVLQSTPEVEIISPGLTLFHRGEL